MIGALLRVCWLGLIRDRVALLLTFVLPIVFFSVFALVFGGLGRPGTNAIRIAVADLDRTDASRRMIAALGREPGLNVQTMTGGEAPRPLDADDAMAIVRGGKRPVAIVLLPGFGATLGDFTNQEPKVELLADSSDPVAPPMVGGLLQKVAMSAAPDLMAGRGLEMFQEYAGGFTPEQQASVGRLQAMLRGLSEGRKAIEGADAATAAGAAGPPPAATPATPDAPDATVPPTPVAVDEPPTLSGPVAVKVVDVLGQSKRSGMIAFYAAGTAVMFLLFSMAGAASTLIEEEETGTLERLLGGGVRIGMLLWAKWLFFAAVGMVQVTVMFLWGALLFQLELFRHLGGFAVMTFFTAIAASAFGLVLATSCRTRAQLSGLSTVVILIMSAIGGSMFPRLFMPPWTVKVGYFTFNAWALDGYQKVFWYEQPTWTLWPQVLVLALLTVALLVLARVLARRWAAA